MQLFLCAYRQVTGTSMRGQGRAIAPTGKLFILLPDVSGMMLQNLLTKGGGIDVGVDFGGADILVAQHLLNGTQVGATLKQSRGKGMAQGVGGDGLRDARLQSLALDHDEDHRAREVMAAAIEEDVILFARLDVEVAAVGEPQLQLLDGFGRDGHEPFLAALAEDADELFVEIKIGEFQIDEFRHAQTAREKHFDDGEIALGFGFGEVDARLQLVHFGGGKHFGQMLADAGRSEKFRGVVVDIPVELQESIEGAHAAQYARLRRRTYADIVQRCGKCFEVFQLHVGHAHLLCFQKRQQFLEIVQIPVDRVRRIVALQLQISLISSHDVRIRFILLVRHYLYL